MTIDIIEKKINKQNELRENVIVPLINYSYITLTR